MAQAEPKQEPVTDDAPPAPRRLDVQRGLDSIRGVQTWIQNLGDLGLVLLLVVLGLALVWFARHAVGIRSNAFLLVVLLLPPATFLAVRRPGELTSNRWLGPLRGFRAWLATMGDVGTAIELGLFSAALLWFAKAIVGVHSAWLLGIAFLTPQVLYLLVSRRRGRPDESG